jgi:hypothetical protein
MEESSANENVISGNNETIEICMNDVVAKDGFEENPSVQIEQVGIQKMAVKK